MQSHVDGTASGQVQYPFDNVAGICIAGGEPAGDPYDGVFAVSYLEEFGAHTGKLQVVRPLEAGRQRVLATRNADQDAVGRDIYMKRLGISLVGMNHDERMFTKLIDGRKVIQPGACCRQAEDNANEKGSEHRPSLVKLRVWSYYSPPICDRTHISADSHTMTLPICLWSGPRNVSTALMYSFAERGDIRVVDEPLYGHYLRVSGAEHPGRDDVLAALDCDGDAVMRSLLRQQARQPEVRLFIKHMAHHLVDIDPGFMRQTCNVFLIRDPREMLPSLTIQVPDAELADTGLQRQWQLYSSLLEAGQQPAVLDSRELLLDPAGVLNALCRHIGLEFTAAMLSWPAGPRAEDGVWAPHWYHAVHKSTGFGKYTPKSGFPERLEPLLAECEPWYERLYEKSIRAGQNED